MKEIQKKITDKLLLSEINRYPVSLLHGKMGLSIYFFQMSKNETKPEYQSIAEQLLEQILQHDLSPNHSIDVEEGLAGVGLGVTWLIKNGFVEGDLNEILETIDDIIFRRIAFQENQFHFSSTKLLGLTGYLIIRQKEQTDTNMRTVYQDLIIKAMNMLYAKIDDDFLNESYSFSIYHYQLPALLWVISKLIEADFYNYRIYKILDELRLRILSRIPLLHSNRLYLLWGLLKLIPCLNQDQESWIKHAKLLHQEISLDEIFENEMISRKIFISNGLSAIYILLHYINCNFPEYRIAFDPQTIYNKLQSSDAWNALLERDYFYNIHHGLLNGFPGVQLVLSHIKQHYEQNA